MDVIIESFIDLDETNLAQGETKALTMVDSQDVLNDRNKNVATKLYYILPKIGKILVVVTEADKVSIGVSNRILDTILITNFPLVKLPSKIIAYKEIIVSPVSGLNESELKNVAQAVADKTLTEVQPKQIPVVKVIDYRDNGASYIVLPTVFHTFPFEEAADPFITDGDPTQGDEILENDGQSLIINQLPGDRLFAGDVSKETHGRFGSAVGFNDNVLVVCASGSRCFYIYNKDGSGGYRVDPTGVAAQFGASILVTSTKIIIGSPDEDKVYSFDLDGTNQSSITIYHATSFGFAMAMHGNKIVIGAHGYRDQVAKQYVGSGHVYNLVNGAIDESSHVGLYRLTNVKYGNMGLSVAINATKVLLGDHYLSGVSKDQSGTAWMFNHDGTGETLIQKDSPSALDRFGRGVALTATHAYIGAMSDNATGYNSGCVYRYDLNGNNELQITAPYNASNKSFGFALAVNNTHLYVCNHSYKVTRFSLAGTNPFDVLPTGQSISGFAANIALSDNYLAIGNISDNTKGTYSGSVCTYIV